MDILVAVASKVAELTVEPIGRQFGYMLFFRRHVRELKDQVEKLKAEREAVQHLVDAARGNCEEIEDIVQNWMCRVEEMIEQAERLYEKESVANTECSYSSCPNPWVRHQLSRKAKKMATDVDQLKGERNFVSISYQKRPECVGPSLEVEEEFESRVSTINEIMDALDDPSVHMIGLHGLVGVGKTTLTEEVAKKAEEKKLFETVVRVEVQHKPLKEIQSQIADQLQLRFDMPSESEIVTASRLRTRLEQEKSLLVFLDDLWERLDLDQVGIPFTGEGNNRCKIILISRSEHLLLNQMNCKRNIKVGLLSNEEAWALFKKKAGINDDSDDPDLLSVAVEVSQKCAQLPLAIVVVARALRNKKNLVDWKDALRWLKSYTSRNRSGINVVYSSLKLSYDYLESKELKSTFLLSAMFSQHLSIEDLFMYSVGLNLLQDVHCMEEARHRLNALVHRLKASSLLLDSYSKYHFTMHDVVRDIALSIASEEQHVLVKRHEKVNEWPGEDQLVSCTAICLHESDIDELPEELNGSNVEFFLLNSKGEDLRIPDSFFKGIQELKVLILTNLAFSSLPSSISLLKKLRTLSLQSCTLEDITIVEHLKKLRVLNFSSSTITRLPCEVGQLSCLQMLNLSNCHKLQVIPPNILSNLKKLEELYMSNSFNQWEAEGLHEGKERASLVELKHLQKLSTLEIDIPDVTVLPKDLFVGNSLERYKISIGTSGGHYSGYEFSRKLTFELNKNIDLDYGAFTLLESVEDLCLQELNGLTSLCQLQSTAQTFCKLQTIKVRRCDQLKSLFSISMIRTLSRLEKIEVTECKSMEEIVAFVDEKNVEKGSATNVVEFLQLRYLTLNNLSTLTDSCFSNKVFPKLEELTLRGRQAKMMWNGNFQAYHFPNVKSLYLSGFLGEEATFPDGLFHGFPNLQQLKVRGSSIEVIFSSSRRLHHDAQNVAPFTSLSLYSLNRLKHIWNEKCQSDLILQNLVTLRVSYCDDLINLGPSFVSLANLTDLVVLRCTELINLLTSSTARTLVQLTRLSITDCYKIEEIITDGEVDAETEIVFMKLKILELSDLANCKNFCCHKYAFNFPLLNEVIIERCPRFKMFCPGSLTTPLLKGVKVEDNKIKWQSNLNETIQQLYDEKRSMDPTMKLSRRRDFISLILSYPMIIGDKRMLKRWMNDYFELRANNCTQASVISELRDRDEWLQYVEPLIPKAIIQEMTLGRRSIFGISQRQLLPSSTLSRRSTFSSAIGSTIAVVRQLSWSPAPPDVLKAISNSATDLAVRQLIQTLISEDDYVRHIHHVRFSTGNDVEKRTVMKKIEAAFKEEENKLKITQEFVGVLRIDLSKCENDAEAQIQVLQQIGQHLELTTTAVDYNVMIRSYVEEEMMSRKYLLLVDGNWRLDLCKVGFEKTNFAGVVVLITTEESGQKNEEPNLAMDLEIRTEDHMLSWELFLWNIETKPILSSDVIQRIAVQIVGVCRGHLLAIALVASSLKDAGDIKLWESTLAKLHYNSSSYDISIFDGMSRVMTNAFINIIWENIHEKEKHCLARCIFIPNVTEAMINDEILISHWNATGLRYTEEEVSHIRKKFVEFYVFLQRRRQLLQKPSKEAYLLPKEIYDILELLNRLSPVVINQMSLWSDEPPEIRHVRKRWHETVEVALMDSGISKLPQSPNCPRLRILCLQGNTGLVEIPPLFFNRISLLQVLNLSYTGIRDLPNSFSNLVELRELYLRGCALLMELPPGIGQLQKLDLDGTRITHLPQEMQELTRLQSLILSFCGYPTRNVGQGKKKCLEDPKLAIFSPGVISSLSRLVHLSIDVSPDDERWNEEAPIILEEISGLKRLKTLGLYVPEVKLLKFILHCKCNPLLFKLVVGRHMQHIISRIPPAIEAAFEKSDKSLKFINGVDIPNEIDMILGRTEAFFLHRHKTIKHFSQFNLEGGNLLRVCILAECSEMQTVFDREYKNKLSVNELRSLTVCCMKNLRDIWVGPSPPYTFFVGLRSLALHNCPNLITIIPAILLGNLLSLEELIVEKCPKVITLISQRSTKLTSGIYLHKLRKVSLLHLPELDSISNGFHIGLSLEKIGFYDCPKLKSLSKSELSSSNLEVIKGEINWWEALKWSEAEWGQQGRPDHLHTIFCPINEEADVMTQLIGDGI